MRLPRIDHVMQALGKNQEEEQHEGLDVELGSEYRQGQAGFGDVPSEVIPEPFRLVHSQSIQKGSRCDAEHPYQHGYVGVPQDDVGVFARRQKHQCQVPLLPRPVRVIDQKDGGQATKPDVRERVFLVADIAETGVAVVVHQILVVQKGHVVVHVPVVVVAVVVVGSHACQIFTVRRISREEVVVQVVIASVILRLRDLFFLLFLLEQHLLHGFFRPAL
mmetsp:Transcript_18949/g.43973  ORF Transcript_18949/g.43973 Transcript_18949/m.43973 type:complete len:219 (+) Transcript_18949:1432-2088(+)